MKECSICRLEELLSYCPATGILIWKVRRGAKAAGSVAGTNDKGHINVIVDYEHYPAHRIAWALYYKEWPNAEIDHINRVRSDNRISNLRLASRTEQLRNRSEVKGVYLEKRTKLPSWYAQIKVGTERINLGTFYSLEEATAARIAAEQKYFGEFSPNFGELYGKSN